LANGARSLKDDHLTSVPQAPFEKFIICALLLRALGHDLHCVTDKETLGKRALELRLGQTGHQLSHSQSVGALDAG